jgi:hypothetical protein
MTANEVPAWLEKSGQVLTCSMSESMGAGSQGRRVRCGVCTLSISVKSAKGISSDQLL